MGPKARGMKRGHPQEGDSDSDPETVESDTDSQESGDDSDDKQDEGGSDSDDQEDDAESEENEGQNYQGMTMQELLRLQEEIGTKAFKDKVLRKGGGIVGQKSNSKPSSKQGGSKTVLKRANKNRPAEVPMMRRAAPRLATLDPRRSTKRMIVRDPRFDDLSGDLNLMAWQENYGFLKEMRKKEKEVLKKELKAEQDPEKKRRMKSIVQRMENQERERARKEKEREVRREEQQEQREALRQGRKPKFVSNKERKLLVKAAHFEDLKKGNKLEKYLERKEKRLKRKEMKRKY